MSVDYKQDYEYANERLCGSLVKRDDEIVYVQEVNIRNGKVSYSRVCSLGLILTCGLEELDLTPPTLGYINLPSSAKYLLRYPKRQYKQGLSPALVGLSSKDYKYLERCVMGVYPNLESSIESVFNEEVNVKAFSRKYAISNTVGGDERYAILYKDISLIGSINPMSLDISLGEGFNFLVEDLKETIGENNIRIV